MENVVLIIHLLLALGIIGVVLLQRSEGGGLGMGGGGGGAGAARPALSPLGKLTWVFAVAFIATSLTLTILAAQRSATGSILDRMGTGAPAAQEETVPGVPAGDDLLPPPAEDAPLTPPRAD